MQSILIKEHVLRALEKQAQAKSANPSPRAVNRNGSFLTPQAKERKRKDSFLSYGSESDEDDGNLSFEDIMEKSGLGLSPSRISTFADSAKKRKSTADHPSLL